MTNEFQVDRQNDAVRLLNWRDFLSFHELHKQRVNDVAVIFVTYNLPGDAENTINILLDEPSFFDIIVIDNCSSYHNYEHLKSKYNQLPNVTLLRTKENLGGAGGYAVGMEFALDRNYKRIVVTEDDASLITRKNFDKLCTLGDKDIHVISFDNNQTTSFAFHYTSYPIELLKLVGVPDPAFFMRCDDLDFSYRVNIWAAKTNIKYVVHPDIAYQHPVIKPASSIWPEYFIIRNSFYTYCRYQCYGLYFLELFKRLPYALTRLIFFNDKSSFIIFFIALYDFVFGRSGNVINQSRLNFLKGLKPFSPAFEWKKSFATQDVSFPSKSLVANNFLRRILHFSDADHFTKHMECTSRDCVITANLNSPFLPVILAFKTIFVVEEVSADNNIITVALYRNTIRHRLLKLISVLLFSLPILALALIFLLLKATCLLVIQKLSIQTQ